MSSEITAASSAPDDQKLIQRISVILRVGVVLSSIVVVIGGVLLLLQDGSQRPDQTVFHGEPPGLTTISGILKGALARDGRAIIQLGVVILLSTPILRVAYSLYSFIRRKDFAYIGITGTVLMVLLYSLLSGRGGH